MKVMVGLFTNRIQCQRAGENEIGSYDLGFGDDCVRKLRVGEVFQAAGIDVIPSVYASAGASGVITRNLRLHRIAVCPHGQRTSP